MEGDVTYHYVKLLIENFWIIALFLLAVWLIRNPKFLARISRVKIGSVEFELLAAKIEAAEAKIETLAYENEEYRNVLTSFDADGPVETVRGKLKALAGRNAIDNATIIKGLAAEASAEEVYSASVMARVRRDPALFDSIIRCLDRLSKDDDLGGIRLKTVWTLASAAHQTLVSAVKYSSKVPLTREQLGTAKATLSRLMINPRVLEDRPDLPSKGVRGPTQHALNWIEKALEKLNT